MCELKLGSNTYQKGRTSFREIWHFLTPLSHASEQLKYNIKKDHMTTLNYAYLMQGI